MPLSSEILWQGVGSHESDELNGKIRKYFYRAHKTCHDGLTAEEETSLDSALIDNLQ